MTHIFFCSTIITVLSLNNIREPKFCVNSKICIKSFLTISEFGKCSFYPKHERNIDYFVSGIEKKG